MSHFGHHVIFFDGICERHALVSAVHEVKGKPPLFDLVFLDAERAAAGVDDGVLVADRVPHHRAEPNAPNVWRWADEPAFEARPVDKKPTGPGIPLNGRSTRPELAEGSSTQIRPCDHSGPCGCPTLEML